MQTTSFTRTFSLQASQAILTALALITLSTPSSGQQIAQKQLPKSNIAAKQALPNKSDQIQLDEKHTQYTGLRAEVLIPGAENVIKNQISDVPQLIRFKAGSEIDHASFSSWAHKNLKLSADYDLKIFRKDSDINSGYTFNRYRQTYKGIPIEGADYILDVKGGKVKSMTGQIFSKLNADATPQLTEADALAKALAYIGAQEYAWQDTSLESFVKKIKNDANATNFPKGELLFAAADGKFTEDNLKLAYKFEIRSSIPADLRIVYVDARNGSVIKEAGGLEGGTPEKVKGYTVYNKEQEMTANYGRFPLSLAYILEDKTRGLGIHTYDFNHNSISSSDLLFGKSEDESSTPSFGSPQTADPLADAHWGAEMTYDFYMSTFKRNSFDGNGAEIINLVHYGPQKAQTTYENSQFLNDWNVIVYGDEGATPLTNLSLVGHEFTHGVTKYTSALDYQGESGALNESFSDMMGTAIEAYALHLTTPTWKFVMGKTLVRDMSNPKSASVYYKQPTMYKGQYYEPTDCGTPNRTQNDFCGVHTNSGVSNYWFYLLWQGAAGTQDNNYNPAVDLPYKVSGIGNKATSIAYNTLLHLTPNATFYDARVVSLEQAGELYGGLTSPEVASVADAWFAVGVGHSSSDIFGLSDDPPLDSYGTVIARDQDANTYVAGSFSGTMTLGSTTLSTPEDIDTYMFIAKYDSAGNALWAGMGNCTPSSICVDKHGNTYVTGTMVAAGIFYGMNGTTDSFAVLNDQLYTFYMILLKYDSVGNLVYALRGGSSGFGAFPENSTQGLSVACDDNDDVYVAGNYIAPEKFGTVLLEADTSSGFGTNAFIVKCSGGQFQSATSITSNGGYNGYVSAQSMARDALGNFYLTGDITGSAQYGSNSINAVGGQDVYVMKVNSNFGFDWVKTAGGTSYNYSNCLSISGNPVNDIAVVGTYAAPATFGGSTLNGSTGFITKLDSSGNFKWAENTLNDVWVASDPLGNSYVTGTNLIQEFDTAGNSLWVDNAIGTYAGASVAGDNTLMAVTGYFVDSYTYNSNTLTEPGEQFFIQTMPIPFVGILNSDSFVCASSSFSLNFEAIGVFNSSNVDTVEVATNPGFSSFTVLGTKTTNAASDTMNLNLSALQANAKYYMRIVSSNPYTVTTGEDLYEFTVRSNPVVSIMQGDTVRTCNGQVQLTATSNPLYSYLWYADSLPVLGDTINSVTTGGAGIYQVIAYYGDTTPNPDGESPSIGLNNRTCFANASTVVISKTIFVDSSVVNLPCDSSHVTIHLSGSDSLYSWSPSKGLNVTTGPTVLASPSVTTTYTVTATFKGGCTTDTPIVVSVKALNITAGPVYLLCDSPSVALSVSGSDGTYAWSPSEGLNVTTGATVHASPTVTTTYTVAATFKGGCKEDTSVVVIVNPPPVATAGSGATDSSITANWNPLSNASSYLLDIATDSNFTHFVSGYNSLNAGNVTTDNIIGLMPHTTYYYRVRGMTNCDTSSYSDTIKYATLKGSGCFAPTITAGGPTTFCDGDSVTLDAGAGWSTYMWNNDETTETITVTESGDYSCAVTLDTCNKVSDTVTVTVRQSVDPDVSILATPSDTICQGTKVTFNATPTNGGPSPDFQWMVNGNSQGTDNSSFNSDSLRNGDYVNVTMTSNANCVSGDSTANSNTIFFKVNAPVTPSVSIKASADTICSGTSATFTATPTNGGSSPSYQWKVNGNDEGISSASFTDSTLNNGDEVSVVLTSSAACASIPTATSKAITMVVNLPVTPLVTITASPGDTICAGTNVTFTASPVNGGTSPTYQWKLNGNNVGTSSSSYSNNTLGNGDVVTVVMTSNATCVSTSTANSTGITITLSGSVTPSVSITTISDTICSGTAVTFTATPVNGGSSPSYQWKVNGNNAGQNSSTFISSSLNNSDSVTVILTSSATCASTPTATSNSVIVTVNASVTPSVSITANPGDTVCSGTSVSFTASAVNGGSSPSYQWKVNGNNAGSDSVSFNSGVLNNGDEVSVVLTTSAACATSPAATSGIISMTISSPVTPSVSITANPGDTICSGTNVSFTASPVNGGPSPIYQWKLNGNNVGTGTSSYSNSSLNDGDIVTVVMTSNVECATTSTANSNAITISLSGSVTPSVAITSTVDTICSGTSVTFTATPTNGGASPSYQWKVNGSNAGTNSYQFSSTSLNNNDEVSVTLTSSATCATTPTAGSNSITMTVNTSVTPSVSITANPGNSICSGSAVTFTATPVNGGTNPSYQWKLNGNNAGMDSSSYSNGALSNGDRVTVVMTSNAACASPVSPGSNVITMTVSNGALAAPVATAGTGATGNGITANWNASNGATSYFLDVSTSNSFSTFVTGYNNLNVGNVTSANVTGLTQAITYYYRVRAQNSCTTSVSSNIISYATTNCSSLARITATPASSVICSLTTQTLSVNIIPGVTYQWQISANGTTWANVVSGGTSSTYTTLSSDGSTNKYYRCLLNNSCYQAASSIAVVDISKTPVVTATNVGSDSVTISWTSFVSGDYNIVWHGTGADTGRVNSVTSDPYIISGLTPNQNVTITVADGSSTCPGVNSGVVNVRTLCGSPVITQLTATPSKGFRVNWTALNGVTAYRVFYRNLVSTSSWSFADTTGGTKKTIEGLTAGQTYAVYLAAKNCPSVGKIGEGSPIMYVSINPQPTCNPTPAVTALSECNNLINGSIIGTGPYFVTLQKISPTVAAPITISVSSSLFNVTVGGSTASSVWQVFARANCGGGNLSAVSNIVTVVVPAACPAITNVITSDPTCNGFTATWNASTCSGSTDYYILIKKNGTLNYNAYPVGFKVFDVINWLTSGTTYNVAIEALTCNGSFTGLSIPSTITLPSCRDEASSGGNIDASTSSQNESVMIYPNPSSGQFIVDLGRTDMGEANVKIELINELGQVVQTDVSEVSGGHLSQMINAPEGIASGIYFVRTSVGNNVYVSRIMIGRE